MVHFCWQDSNHTRCIALAVSVIDADAFSGNHFMGFQLRVMDVVGQ